ncbi:MAG TPA: hypothetical protein H9881_19170 [Candidatus Stackebrandtia excrementipullorum]|nr:hypothetical protein [Candidatus Stackebrandtia excrementipullorum]
MRMRRYAASTLVALVTAATLAVATPAVQAGAPAPASTPTTCLHYKAAATSYYALSKKHKSDGDHRKAAEAQAKGDRNMHLYYEYLYG